jgi:hypothetical protein
LEELVLCKTLLQLQSSYSAMLPLLSPGRTLS